MVLAEKFLSRWMNAKRITIEKNRCTHAKNQKSSCNLCVESCPVSAIKIKESVKVVLEACLECMICTVSCPTDVFSDKMYKSYLEQMDGRTTIEIACQQQASSSQFVIVPCLGMLDELILLYGLQQRKKFHIRLNETKCKTCSYKILNISSFLEKLIDRVASITQEKVEVYINKEEYNYGEQQQFSRRELFSFFSKKMRSSVILPFIEEEKDTNKEKEKIALSAKRRFFIQLLKKQNQNVELTSEVVKTAKVMITNNCTGCLQCTYVCPTGSLYSDENKNEINIKQNLLNCVACNSCQDICPEKSLSLKSGNISLKEYVENKGKLVHSFEKKRCTTCGNTLDALQSTICIDCQNKRKQSEAVLSFW